MPISMCYSSNIGTGTDLDRIVGFSLVIGTDCSFCNQLPAKQYIWIWLPIKPILFCFCDKLFGQNSSVVISVWYVVSRILLDQHTPNQDLDCSPHTKPDRDSNRRVLPKQHCKNKMKLTLLKVIFKFCTTTKLLSTHYSLVPHCYLKCI